MPFIITDPCIETKDTACVDVCPVDCIYVGERKSYINANECIECGACEPECPVDAIFVDRTGRKDEQKAVFIADSIDFFAKPLPGRDAPLGDPGGAGSVGELGVDTPMVTTL